MSVFVCDAAEPFEDYREQLAISDGTIVCSESGIKIPKGQPYAVCEGFEGGYWTTFNQALECWRYLRNLKQRDGTCFLFQGVEETLAVVDDPNNDELFVQLGWNRIKRQAQARYAQGKGPRLHKHEKIALDSGLWYEWIQYPKSRDESNHAGGLLWLDGTYTFVCSKCETRHSIYERATNELCESCEKDVIKDIKK